MCVETMDVRSTHAKQSNYLLPTSKSAKMRWRQLRVFDEEEDEACRRLGAGAIKGNNRNPKRRRAELAFSHIIIDRGQEERRRPVYEERRRPVYEERRRPVHEDRRLAVLEACADQAGAMAPRNTTQYLMSHAYEDTKIQTAPDSHEKTSAHVYADSLSPSRVYKELDSCYESCLAFQQREFEEVFGLC